MSVKQLFILIFVPTVIFSSILSLLVILRILNEQTTISAPEVPAETITNRAPQWIRVDTDFQNKTCVDFCSSKGKFCSSNQCPTHEWCHVTGGMAEIETWDPKIGTVCDRTWPGRCDLPMDRYPPIYNFLCCCI